MGVLQIFIMSIGISYSHTVLASSCCGQSPSSFPVSFLGQKISILGSFAQTESLGRIYSNKHYLDWTDKERKIQSLGLTAVWQYKDRQQLFLMTSFNRGIFVDEVQAGSVQNYGDTLLGYNYEILSEYSYSLWKPVIFISALLNLPTGVSIYDNTKLSEGADVTGHNQWGMGLGLTLKKVYYPLSLIFQIRTIELFRERFSEMEVSNFYDSSVSFFANYSTTFYSLTLNMGYTFNDISPRKVNSISESSSRMQNSTVLLGLQKNVKDNWMVGFNYLNQTWLGPASNSLLNKVVSLNLSYNFY